MLAAIIRKARSLVIESHLIISRARRE